MGTEYILELKHISKSFPGVKALDDVTLCVRPGTVHSLMGENGAGKSTLMKCLFGIYSFDEGRIILEAKTLNFQPIRSITESCIHGASGTEPGIKSDSYGKYVAWKISNEAWSGR